MEGIDKSFTTIADRYLNDFGIGEDTSKAIRGRLVGISRTQTPLHRIYGNDYFHYQSFFALAEIKDCQSLHRKIGVLTLDNKDKIISCPRRP